jgi:hypothetical protein
MRSAHLPCLRGALIVLCILMAVPCRAENVALLSVGPRFGFSGKEPLLGKQQRYNFYLADLAATLKLPWAWRLFGSPWSIETRLLASAGALMAVDEVGFMATGVPMIALSGWNGLVSLDAGLGLGFFSRYKFGEQDFGGPVQIVFTTALEIRPVTHAFTGFRLQHFSDAGIYGPDKLGVDLYIVEVGYRF